jgi:hypothetical protein
MWRGEEMFKALQNWRYRYYSKHPRVSREEYDFIVKQMAKGIYLPVEFISNKFRFSITFYVVELTEYVSPEPLYPTYLVREGLLGSAGPFFGYNPQRANCPTCFEKDMIEGQQRLMARMAERKRRRGKSVE